MEEQAYAPLTTPMPKRAAPAPHPPVEVLHEGQQWVIVVDKKLMRVVTAKETEDLLVLRIEPR